MKKLFELLLSIIPMFYPFILLICLIKGKIINPDFSIFSWKIMCFWLIYIIPILYWFYFRKEFLKELKDALKQLKKEIKENKSSIILIFFIPTVVTVPFLDTENYRGNELFSKKSISYLKTISTTTFLLSIYLFYDRFQSLQNQLLTGDLFFLIIPFFISIVLIFNYE
jgi:hypothetical protein